MDYTTKIGDRPTQAHINYQCPCGCVAGLTFDQAEGSEHLGMCCCGRLLWLGPAAHEVVTRSFREGIEYLVDRGTVTLPWGDDVPSALAIPVEQLAVERKKRAAGEVLTKVTDPVCRMMIYPKDAVATSVYLDETHYFCAESCKTRFDADPTRYITAAI